MNLPTEPARILIVEDESIVALDIQNSLTQLGYQVCGRAIAGDEAIRLAMDTRPDLILMDIRLAGAMDGIEAAECIHAVLDTPIIFVTAYADQATINRAKIAQPFGYITKPLELRELHTTIEISLYRHAMELRERQNSYRVEQVFNTMPHGLILLAEDGTIEIANQRALEYLGALTQDGSLGIGDQLNHLNGQPTRDYLSSSTGIQSQQTGEIVVEGPPERVFVVSSVRQSDAPRHRADSGRQGWVVTVQEITEARQHERAVRQQERLAAVGQLAAGIAHDFGNMLSTISLATQIIPQLEANLSSQSAEYLKRIRQQVQRATDLIAQVLDFSRTSVLEKATVDLIPLYKTWMKLLTQLMPENIRVEFNYPNVPCTIDADPTRMQQVLWNLALNARDALPDGGQVTIALDRVTHKEDRKLLLPELVYGEWVSVQISDNGLGIARDALPHIFEPFFTTKLPGKGTGLGLAQVYGIVEQHGGLIHVASDLGKGTTFTVFWPAAQRPPSGCLDETATPIVMPKGNGEMLLVAEDHRDTRQATADGLKALNYDVIEAVDGQEALAILQDGNSAIRLVVTDHIMPHMGAVEFCRALKQSGMDLPVIVVSGYSRDEDIPVLDQLGVIEFIRKPVGLEHLARVIAQTLREH